MRISRMKAKLFGAFLAIIWCVTAFADQPAGLAPAGPNMAGGVPVMYFGVKSCGITILWLTMEDGHMFRIDKDHHPKDMDAFMSSIGNLPHDLIDIPCAAQI